MALLLRYDAAVRAVSGGAPSLLQAARRQAEVLRAEISINEGAQVPDGLVGFLSEVESVAEPCAAQVAWQRLASVPLPVSLVGTDLLHQRFDRGRPAPEPEELPRAVCIATLRGVPVTDVLVVRPNELDHLGMTVRLVSAPEWAERCIVEPVTTLGRDALALPRYEFSLGDGTADEFGLTLTADRPLRCAVEQPILAPALDCPIQMRLTGDGHEQVIEVAGFQRLRLRPFDPSRDTLTEHEQTDSRLLAMFGQLDAPEFDTGDVRAFCRLFAACVRAAQVVMFEKIFMQGSRVSEAEFHNELERLLLADPELDGRLTRRDAVAEGFDDLLHDDVIAELKVSRGGPVTVDHCARYVGQPTQYGVGRGSQLSVLVVFDHGRKEAPPRRHRQLHRLAAAPPSRSRRPPVPVTGRGAHRQHQPAHPQCVVSPARRGRTADRQGQPGDLTRSGDGLGSAGEAYWRGRRRWSDLTGLRPTLDDCGIWTTSA